MLNKLAVRILNYFKIGINYKNIVDLSRELSICRPTTIKYIKLLEKEGYIKKETVSNVGGTTGDATKKTIITRMK
jgi:DNA-binding Lrp family transcriptional regulator